MSLTSIVFLYLAFRAKQLTGDFLLSSWSARDKSKPFGQGGLRALSLHAGIHAACAFVVLMIFAPLFWWLAIVDFAVHFFIDKCKALLNNKMGWTYNDNAYWRLFGIDQEAHNLTHLSYIILIVMSSGITFH
jgi:hypothetical protein